MPTYIDREALLEAIDTEREELLAFAMFGAEHVVVHHARRLIEEAPAADVVERKRGEWVRQDDYFCCSECGQSVSELCVPWFKYCPACGADMREVEHETN